MEAYENVVHVAAEKKIIAEKMVRCGPPVNWRDDDLREGMKNGDIDS